MVTLNSYRTYGANRNVLEIVGLSTDVKPTDIIEGMALTNGSTFYCMDNQSVFMYDEENAEWLSQ